MHCLSEAATAQVDNACWSDPDLGRLIMRTESPNGTLVSPTRILEMLTDRFGAFEAIAMASIKLGRHVPEDELSMDRLVADAVLEFGDDLRAAAEAVETWTREQAVCRAN
jgi:hypothetical protein